MNANNFNIEDLLPFYAMDAVTDEERAFVDAYLETHPAARAELATLQTSADALALTVEPLTPPDSVKAALMGRVMEERKAPKPDVAPAPATPVRQSWFQQLRQSLVFPTVAVAACAVAVFFGVRAQGLQSQLAAQQSEIVALTTDNQRLSAETASLLVQTKALEAQLDEQANALLMARTTEPSFLELASTVGDADAAGQFWNASDEQDTAVLLLTGMPVLDASLAYQLWYVDAEGVIASEVLTVDDTGRGVLVLNEVADLTQFTGLAITIEPAGGSIDPTGDVVLLGTF